MGGAGELPVYTAADPPRRCPAGHDLGPNRVTVGFWHCRCDKVKPGSIGHLGWRCRECEVLIVGDGHTDDSGFFH